MKNKTLKKLIKKIKVQDISLNECLDTPYMFLGTEIEFWTKTKKYELVVRFDVIITGTRTVSSYVDSEDEVNEIIERVSISNLDVFINGALEDEYYSLFYDKIKNELVTINGVKINKYI